MEGRPTVGWAARVIQEAHRQLKVHSLAPVVAAAVVAAAVALARVAPRTARVLPAAFAGQQRQTRQRDWY